MTIVTDFTNDVFVGEMDSGPCDGLAGSSIGTAGWLVGLIGDGIIGGVGAVLGFVPQMLVLFFMLAILEDVGYMARVAFIMDRIFRKFGLSGKSFIPMLIGSGCGVPGVMASRTIEQDRDRKMTIMTTTFIPCGAKMPIIGLIAGALFHNSGWVATAAYFIGVAAVIVSGIMLKKTKMFAGDPAPFVMELPAYHAPAWTQRIPQHVGARLVASSSAPAPLSCCLQHLHLVHLQLRLGRAVKPPLLSDGTPPLRRKPPRPTRTAAPADEPLLRTRPTARWCSAR